MSAGDKNFTTINGNPKSQAGYAPSAPPSRQLPEQTIAPTNESYAPVETPSRQLPQQSIAPTNENSAPIETPSRQIIFTPAANKINFKPFTSNNFRPNLIMLTGIEPASSQAHHVFPQAEEFSAFFNSKGINIHDPQYGSWWTTPAHQQQAAAYNAQWRQWIAANPNAPQSAVLDYGRQIMSQFGLYVNY